jgi:hypothetical protein
MCDDRFNVQIRDRNHVFWVNRGTKRDVLGRVAASAAKFLRDSSRVAPVRKRPRRVSFTAQYTTRQRDQIAFGLQFYPPRPCMAYPPVSSEAVRSGATSPSRLPITPWFFAIPVPPKVVYWNHLESEELEIVNTARRYSRLLPHAPTRSNSQLRLACPTQSFPFALERKCGPEVRVLPLRVRDHPDLGRP